MAKSEKKKSLSNHSDTNLTKSSAALHHNGDSPGIRLSLSDLRSGSSTDRYKNNILNYYFNDKIYQIDEDETAAARNAAVTHRIKRTPRDSLTNTPALKNGSSSNYVDVEKVPHVNGGTKMFDDNFLEEDPLMEDSFTNELRKSGANLKNASNSNMDKKKDPQSSSTGAIGNNHAEKSRGNSLPGAENKGTRPDKMEEFFLGKTSKMGSNLNIKAAPGNTNSSFTSLNSVHSNQPNGEYNFNGLNHLKPDTAPISSSRHPPLLGGLDYPLNGGDLTRINAKNSYSANPGIITIHDSNEFIIE
jgi:hypothetical protein